MTEDPDQLLALSSVSHEPRDEAWGEVETRLGLRLPRDFKLLCERYEEHAFAGFLHLLDLRKPHWRERAEMLLDADRAFRDEIPEETLFPIHPEPGGILPWAVTDNGDRFYWITRNSPEEWPTMIQAARSPDARIYFHSSVMLVSWIARGLLFEKATAHERD